MPHQERVDPFELLVFRLAGVSAETRPLVARIIEEGAMSSDLLTPPPRMGIVLAAIAVRAFRPPFLLRSNSLLGPAEIWDVGENHA